MHSICTSSMRSDIFMMTSSGNDCRKGTLQTHRCKEGTLRHHPQCQVWKGFDVSSLSGWRSIFRHNVDIWDSVKRLNAALQRLTTWPWWHCVEGTRIQSSFLGPLRVKSGAAVGCSPVKQLHWMRKAAETALHEYGLVALAVNNPQLAVRLCCTSKDRGRGSD